MILNFIATGTESHNVQCIQPNKKRVGGFFLFMFSQRNIDRDCHVSTLLVHVLINHLQTKSVRGRKKKSLLKLCCQWIRAPIQFTWMLVWNFYNNHFRSLSAKKRTTLIGFSCNCFGLSALQLLLFFFPRRPFTWNISTVFYVFWNINASKNIRFSKVSYFAMDLIHIFHYSYFMHLVLISFLPKYGKLSFPDTSQDVWKLTCHSPPCT